MAVTATTLLSGTYDGTDASSYTTASVTPTPARLQLLTVLAAPSGGGTPNIPTASGNGLTWVRVAGNNFGAANNRLTVFRALGNAPTSGTITIDFGGQTQTYCAFTLTEFANVIQTGTNGSGAIIQSVATNSVGTVTTLTATLAAFSDVDNATFGALGLAGNRTVTEGSGFTQLGEVAGSAPNATVATEWKNTNDTTVDWSWTTAIGASAVAIEIGEGPPVWVRTASIAGDGQFNATAFRKRFRTASIDGNGDFAASAQRVKVRTASIAGDGQFNATAFRNQSRSASVAGNGDWAATAFVVRSRSASIAGNGAWDASAYANRVATVAVAGNGSWAASAVATRFCSVTISGNGSWQASAFLAGTAACSIVGAGEWAASATCTRFVQVSVAGSGVWAVAAFAVRSRQAAISGNGSWLGSGFVTRFVSCNVVGSGVWAAVCSGGRIGEQQRFGGTPQSRRELDRLTADARLAAILQDDEEVLLCLLT